MRPAFSRPKRRIQQGHGESVPFFIADMPPGIGPFASGTAGKQVLYNALCATLDTGDGVIILALYWVSYPDMVVLAGGKPVIVPRGEADGFKPSAASLRAAIAPRMKWLVLNSPSNPTGAGYSTSDLRAIAGVLLDHQHVLVLTDDMYEHIRYDGWEFATIAAVKPRLFGRVLTCNGCCAHGSA